MTEYKMVVPTPSIEELQEGDLVTYIAKSAIGEWLHPEEIKHELFFEYDETTVILEVKRAVKHNPGDLAFVGGELATYLGGSDGSWFTPSKSYRDSEVASTLAEAVPQEDFFELVDAVEKGSWDDIAAAGEMLVREWRAATNNDG